LTSLANATLTFNAYTVAARLRGEPENRQIALASLSGLVILLLLPLRRRPFRGVVLVLAIGAVLICANGCGSKGRPVTPTPTNSAATPGSYTVSVSATSGNIAHNVTVLVTIQ
jgi:hypothetical protein